MSPKSGLEGTIRTLDKYLDIADISAMAASGMDGKIVKDFYDRYVKNPDWNKPMEKLIEPSAVESSDRDVQELLDSLMDTFATAGLHMDLVKIKGDAHELRFRIVEPCKLTVEKSGKGYRTRAFIGGEELILECFRLGKKEVIAVFKMVVGDDVADIDMDVNAKVEMAETKARRLLKGFDETYRWAIEKEESSFIERSAIERKEAQKAEAERIKKLKEKIHDWGSW